MVVCFRDFHVGAVLSKAITSSFLALIPKNNDPLGMDDYRLICLVRGIYKILSKVLASRVKRVIGKVISLNQITFVPGRQLLNGVMIANEIVDYTTKENKSCLLFNVDFEKVCEKVSRYFLCYMLLPMGFRDKWLKWIEALVFSSHMSMMVNGSRTNDFVIERGLRQGDPLSSFLFMVVVIIGSGNSKGKELISNWWTNILSLDNHVGNEFFNLQCRFVVYGWGR